MYDRWDIEILNNRKLEFSNSIKDSHDPDFYISNIEDRYARKYLASLRLSCHPLRIEVGRYTRLPRNDRLCQHCNLNVIEDEEHFMTTCTLYTQTRNMLYQELNNLGNRTWIECQTNREKLAYLLQPHDSQTAKLVIQYTSNYKILF